MPRGLRHVALSISFLSPMARRPDALFATNIASLIFLPDLRFLASTSFQSLNRPSLSSGSSSRISLLKQSFSVSRPRLRPPGNIHRWSRLLLTNNTRPRFVATSFDDFAITLPHRLNAESSMQILFHPTHRERQRLVQRTCRKRSVRDYCRPNWAVRVISGLPPVATVERRCRFGSVVPTMEAMPTREHWRRRQTAVALNRYAVGSS
jgi:hypothetical protein